MSMAEKGLGVGILPGMILQRYLIKLKYAHLNNRISALSVWL